MRSVGAIRNENQKAKNHSYDVSLDLIATAGGALIQVMIVLCQSHR